MKPEKRETFLGWYANNRETTFDMQRDLVQYYRIDVNILRESCHKFRRLFLEESFEKAITTSIASSCNLMYRRNCLKKDTIGAIPRKGYA